MMNTQTLNTDFRAAFNRHKNITIEGAFMEKLASASPRLTS